MTAPKSPNTSEYELSLSSSRDDEDHSSAAASHDEHAAHLLTGNVVSRSRRRYQSNVLFRLSRPLRQWYQSRRQRSSRLARSCACSRRTFLRRFMLLSYSFLATIIVLAIVGATFFPSYTSLPPHYIALKERATASKIPGRGNPTQQKVFIAASIYDPGGDLANGPWAANVLSLIDLLGPQNTFLSIYENDSGQEAESALLRLKEKVTCAHSLVFEQHLPLESLSRITTPDGSKRVKRITYLAEVRNRALRPFEATDVVYDKLLYLNDVVFDPIDVLQLLFSTNADQNGRANYRAACAVDFIMPFKFYDTFATRDLGGFSMGTPFFPWFAYSGDRRTHSDVIEGKDAVRVKSCWGGLVAFDARFFQQQPPLDLIPETAGSQSPANITAPYRFRAEKDLFWDASECCLIQADIESPDPDHTGIFMNPFVRVAYDTTTLSWLWFTRRFERLYTPIHIMVDIVASMPGYNPRRHEVPWQEVEESVWMADSQHPTGGSFQTVSRLATHSGFCGRRKLSVMKDHFTSGERNYEFIEIPSA